MELENGKARQLMCQNWRLFRSFLHCVGICAVSPKVRIKKCPKNDVSPDVDPLTHPVVSKWTSASEKRTRQINKFWQSPPPSSFYNKNWTEVKRKGDELTAAPPCGYLYLPPRMHRARISPLTEWRKSWARGLPNEVWEPNAAHVRNILCTEICGFGGWLSK